MVDLNEDFPAGRFILVDFRVKPTNGKLYWFVDGPAAEDLVSPPLITFKV